jgi:hypothetical protein
MTRTPFFSFLFPSGQQGQENLDRPLSNFDVIGVPVDQWSSSIWACHQNVLPSCLVAFLCPCVLWAQVVVRAQIPLLIALKNALPWLRAQSGFGLFVDYFFWSLVVMAGLTALLVCVRFPAQSLFYLVLLVLLAVGGSFIYFLGHVRTAFKEKYVF